MKNVFLLFGVIVLVSFSTFADHINVSGNVSGNWDTDTVFVDGPVMVPDGETLTVMPGVNVIFNGFFKMTVAGRILSSGNEIDSIFYTISDTTGFYNLTTEAGAWNGFWFDHLAPANDSTVFDYCSFSFSKAIGPDSVYRYGGVMCIRDFDRIRISHCRFFYNYAIKNGGAIYAVYSNPLVSNCYFRDNSAGTDVMWGYGGAVCLEHSEGLVRRNVFRYNSSTGVGGGLSFEYSDPDVTGNIFEANFSAIGGGLCGLRSDGVRPLACNLVVGNGSVFYGGGMGFATCTLSILNNTVVGNYTSGGGGMFFNFESYPIIRNNIVWGNTHQGAGGPQVYIWDALSAPEFYYNDIQGGVEAFGGGGGLPGGFIGIYEDNLDVDPEFTGSAPYFYELSSLSFCKNAGIPDTSGLMIPATDLAGMNRIRQGRIDIGAFEVQEFSVIGDQTDQTFYIYPNPAAGNIYLHCMNPVVQESEFHMYDSKGMIVARGIIQPSGAYVTDISPYIPADLVNGLYTIKISGTEVSSIYKVIINK